MGRIVAVCASANKGERKKEIGSGRLIRDHGLEGDAHAGPGDRQISLLSLASIGKMADRGLEFNPGDFAENLTVDLDLSGVKIGSRLCIGEEAVLAVTRIGKECHAPCAIYRQAGVCIMPKEGVFARVLRSGAVQSGDEIKIMPNYRFGVVTASDKAARGERIDQSGPLIGEMLLPWGDLVSYRVVPDDRGQLSTVMRAMIDEEQVDLLVTTGGTGFGPRDVTPEATVELIERLVPGIPEAMRAASLSKTPRAMLSRGTAGIRGRTLIINLPGSPRGVRENLQVVLPVLEHALGIITGETGECGGEASRRSED